jgi:hypothetical protein
MSKFQSTLEYITNKVYEPNQLTVTSVQEEAQNAKYGAGTFKLGSKTVRFRVANTTPTKIGQFVAFWEKDQKNVNQPYYYKSSPDLLVITTFESNNKFGQFVFPKDVLLNKKILKSHSSKGKMGIRVYPSWDTPTSTQAIKTQSWQQKYFIDFSESKEITNQKINELYSI